MLETDLSSSRPLPRFEKWIKATEKISIEEKNL